MVSISVKVNDRSDYREKMVSRPGVGNKDKGVTNPPLRKGGPAARKTAPVPVPSSMSSVGIFRPFLPLPDTSGPFLLSLAGLRSRGLEGERMDRRFESSVRVLRYEIGDVRSIGEKPRDVYLVIARYGSGGALEGRHGSKRVQSVPYLRRGRRLEAAGKYDVESGSGCVGGEIDRQSGGSESAERDRRNRQGAATRSSGLGRTGGRGIGSAASIRTVAHEFGDASPNYGGDAVESGNVACVPRGIPITALKGGFRCGNPRYEGI